MEAKAYNPQQQLIERCRTGDRQAQKELYHLYARAMYNTALRITGDEAEAQDVLQEAFVDAFLHLSTWQESATFGAWLKRIVVNKSINAVRKKKAERWDQDSLEQVADEDDPGTDSSEARPWRVEQVMNALQQLPQGYRLVFQLYLLEGYDHSEIAVILGITESGSKSQLNRAKRKIKELLTLIPHG